MKYTWLLSIIFVCQVAVAQSPEARIAELERIVDELLERVSTLESQVQGSQSAPNLTVSTGDATDIQNWRLLRMGMSEEEVKTLLGSPDKVEANQFFFTWYYDYPLGGKVQFDSESQRIEGWNEP